MGKELKKALIIFAKRPVPRRVKTRLTPPLSPEEAAALYRCMLLDVLAKVATLAGVAKHIFYEPEEHAAAFFAQIAPGMARAPQRGEDLGERMANAFGELLAMGYGQVAIIGTDLPDLPLTYVEEAFGRLATDGIDALFGPSEDGGYYLLAMRELHDGLFRDVPWSSGEVLAKSLERAKQAGARVSLLPTWHDVDTADDLERPELLDPGNGAPRTREFLGNWLKRRNPAQSN
ncbi:MAG: TIGR04282 family arsenosugar biosynthesis glycosyltransferase [Geobacteraceae bacterium]|nr:TIGR04282 family arsenosugar biosynthesis glycosyltransferase [Geobacteraceae bacterium]